MSKSHATLPDHLDLWRESLQWQPSETQQAQFSQLYEGVLAGNQQLNLTRLTEPDEFWEKHLWDSLSGIAPWIAPSEKTSEPEISEPAKTDPERLPEVQTGKDEPPLKVVDIGTGGGFPGVPVAIALHPIPCQLTLVDSTRKKIIFLQTLCHQLKLQATCLAIRAETLGRDIDHRAQYDLGLIRAVGAAATCAEYILPLLKVGGQAVLYRGQWQTDDTEALLPVVDLLGAELTDVQAWQTPLSQSQHHCVFLHKVKPTPADFPRAVGVPGKTPLH